MKINTALILCAGLGKRLNPITLKTPKPLLKIKDLTLLDHCIILIKQLNIKKILINSFYLKEQIIEFVNNHNYDIEIKVIEDGDHILNTGGGILNLVDKSNEEDFLIFNPDTIWKKDYSNEIHKMTEIYFNQNLKNVLLVVKKDLSFDKSLKGDFGLNKNLIDQTCKDFIYTGCQIMNKTILKNEKIKNFSITKIWNDLLKNKKLHGFESKLKFYHATNFGIFKKLQDL
tara:strand:+ start:1630 stop:2316 length:687 start_codon:yes stop_codon:yes gene_type:complete